MPKSSPAPRPVPIRNGLPVANFDLAATLNSGQVFHWHEQDGGFVGLIGGELVTVSQPEPGMLHVSAGHEDLVSRYLALDHDLVRMQRTLPKRDAHLKRALQYSPGLRILRQPRWECLATFITSSLKQVAHIRQISLTLRERFGQPAATLNGKVLHTYPTPEALARAGEAALRACGLGYRAKFLHQTASRIAEGNFDLEAPAALNDEAACELLCTLPGVGPKIAQCTLLFSYERLGVFPIDVWIERALRELYFAGTAENVSANELREFAKTHFGPYRGYAQQWLFHHARTSGTFSRLRKVV
ncbi:DNA glycosylase [Verrucomicrobium sp. BvORR034]|uniref:DNA-3-methyladenine glycosylase family protein n=1 Tax=Verrucomicrobium sp. BvORR034 TaxID=1396418 RepID=UPI000678FD2B|nr:DNA glycosylase [Verrucomicrobium sp. BvORR034]